MKIKYKNIIYFESRKRIIYIYTKNKEAKHFYGKMNDVIEHLNSDKFIRCHQSFLDRRAHV